MATRTVICLVIGVTNPLNFLATPRTRLTIATVNGHAFAEGGHLLRKTIFRLRPKSLDPEVESLARSCEQALPLFRFEFVGKSDGGQLGSVQNFIRISVAYTADDPRIGKRPL